VLREGLRTDDLKSPAIKGTVSLVELPGFIDPNDVENIVRGLNDILVNDKIAEHRSAVVKALTAISVVHPALVENITLPLLFHNLPETAPGIDKVEARDQYRDVLKSLSELCVQPALFETLVVRVTTKLDLMSSSPSISSENDSAEYRECEVAFIWDLLNALLGVIETKIKHNHLDVVKHFDRIIPRLNTLAFNAAGPSTQPTEPLFRDGRLLTIVGRLTETMVWELSLE
jgi:DNA repair/transcription protein MET18/MMS19